jgi:NADH dehydrogenase
VIDFGRVRLRGALAWWIWGIAHIYFLIGLRNRLAVAINWLWIHTLDQRGARLITQGRAVPEAVKQPVRSRDKELV